MQATRKFNGKNRKPGNGTAFATSAAAASGAETNLMLDQPITENDKVRGGAAGGFRKGNNYEKP